MFLADVIPTVPVVGAELTPPPITSVTNISQPPPTFTVRLPSLDAQPTFSKTQLALIGGAMLFALYTLRGKR